MTNQSADGRILELMEELKDAPKDTITGAKIYEWGTELLYLSLRIGVQTAEAEMMYQQKVTDCLDQGMKIGESEHRAKSSPEYLVKKQFEIYYEVSQEAQKFLKRFLTKLEEEKKASST